MALCPQELGSFTVGAVNMAAPSAATDGYATNGARYVNLWMQATGGRYLLYTYLYRTGIGWVRYTELPFYMGVTSDTNGLLIELEVRGAERIYARRVGTAPSNTGTAIALLEGFTYR